MRKQIILEQSERAAATRQEARRRASFFHNEDLRYLRFLIPEGLRVLELGCGTGDVLAGLKPSYGLGVDFSPATIEEARRQHPNLEFRVGDIEDANFLGSLPGEAGELTLSAPGNHTGLINQTVAVHAPLDSLHAFEPGEHGRSLGL